jgi:riboflavin synthase
MFTGLVETTGTLQSITADHDRTKLVLTTSLAAEIEIGESIAVNGTCLTAELVNAGAGTIDFHILHETGRCTNLGAAMPGEKLNLERPLALGGRLGGHLVMGHVDATAKVLEVSEDGGDHVVEIELPTSLAPLAIAKGSIAVDGISLTIATLGKSAFQVCIIPHTWTTTNMCDYVPDRIVNLEMDMIGKYVSRSLECRAD